MTSTTYVGPRHDTPRGYVSLTFTQRVHAREQYRSAIRGARHALREARLWRQMSDQRAAERYTDQHANARAMLRLAAAERKRAALYAWHWQTGLAHAGTAWDERAWAPSTSDSDARAVTRWPHTMPDGQLVWACCLSSIGPTCQHRTSLPVIGLAGVRNYGTT